MLSNCPGRGRRAICAATVSVTAGTVPARARLQRDARGRGVLAHVWYLGHELAQHCFTPIRFPFRRGSVLAARVDCGDACAKLAVWLLGRKILVDDVVLDPRCSADRQA